MDVNRSFPLPSGRLASFFAARSPAGSSSDYNIESLPAKNQNRMSDLTQLERDSRIRTTALVILTFIAVAFALYFLRPVLLPFVLALFIASGLVPVLNLVQGVLDSSRPVAIGVTAVLSIFVVGVIWAVIWVSVSGLLHSEDRFHAGFNSMLVRVGDALQRYATKDQPDTSPNLEIKDSQDEEVRGDGNPAKSEGTQSDEVDDEEDLNLPTEAALDFRQQFEPLRKFVAQRMEIIVQLVAQELFAVFSSGLLVMIFLFFLLLGGSHVKLPENNIWSEVDSHVRQYIVAKSAISLVTGTVFGLVLWLFGVPLAFVLGILAFFLNFIPNLGPIIASLLPVPLVWVLLEATWAGKVEPGQSGYFGIIQAIFALLLAAAVQFVSGNVVEPKIMGDQFRLHPIAILMSLMFWYMIWGLVGAFLAVPITSALKVMLAELDSTRPAADLLEGNLAILAKRDCTAKTASA